MNNKYNILLTNASNIYAGGEFYVFEIAAELQRRGHVIVVACKPDNLLLEKCKNAGIKTIPVDFPPTGQIIRYVRLLNTIIKEYSINIIHTNTNYDRTVGAFAAWQSGIHHIANVHSFQSIQHNITHWIRNRFAVDKFLVDGVCVQELLTKEDSISPSKISVVHLGVNPDVMKRNEEQRGKVRHEFRITDKQIVIGNVARLVPFKGQEYLLTAFGKIVQRHPDERLMLVGDGLLEEEYRRLVTSLGIEQRVIFAGFRDDLNAVYSAFDIYVHPSIEGGGETFPFAVLQALSQELPVIVTRVGDVPAMVEEGVNGFVVDEKDENSIAEKLNILLIDENLRREMAEKSRERLLTRFTTGKMADVVESIYDGIVKQKL